MVRFYGLWNTEVQQVVRSSSGTNNHKKKKKNQQSAIQFQTHYQEPRRRRRKSTWDPISNPLSLCQHLLIRVITKNLEQQFFPKNCLRIRLKWLIFFDSSIWLSPNQANNIEKLWLNINIYETRQTMDW